MTGRTVDLVYKTDMLPAARSACARQGRGQTITIMPEVGLRLVVLVALIGRVQVRFWLPHTSQCW